jgi:siroheme synthase (precorrin-2 oxidase/ferrochelatase)
MTVVNLLSTPVLDNTVEELKKAQRIVQIAIGSNASGYVVTDAIRDAINLLQGFLDHRLLKEAVEKLCRNEISVAELVAVNQLIQNRDAT